MTICSTRTTPRTPVGKKPPWFTRFAKLAVWPSSPTPNRITTRPMTSMARMVTIFMSANQNSSSPNMCTAIRFTE